MNNLHVVILNRIVFSFIIHLFLLILLMRALNIFALYHQRENIEIGKFREGKSLFFSFLFNYKSVERACIV